MSKNVKKVKIASWSELKDRQPVHALVANVDLVIIRYDEKVSVLYGRCLHRGALLADGHISGDDILCDVHGWDYRYRTGVSAYNNEERLHKFNAWIDVEADALLVDENELREWERKNPQPYWRKAYLGQYADIHGAEEEPHNRYIQQLAKNGLKNFGAHGKVTAMGVPLSELPRWSDIQIRTAQLDRRPLDENEEVDGELIVGPNAKKPLRLNIPLLISDMSFGALSQEAKVALAKGAEMVGTGICSGEGGMLPEERAENSRYFYELATGMFGWDIEKAAKCGAFHFKAGQGAKTGTGGHLPGAKVTEKIAEVRGLQPGEAAVSPARFAKLESPDDFRALADQVREASGGIPVGFKMSAQHIEKDIQFALDAGADYIILDGRGGGTGAAPEIFKNNISLPTIPALARARKYLDESGRPEVTLIITGGLRIESDFVKALALGAEGVAIANAAIQSAGCIAMRACHTNKCPVGVASQEKHFRDRMRVEKSAERVKNFLEASVSLMKVLARACGHHALRDFTRDDLVTWKREMAYLTGIDYAGVMPL